MRLVEIDQMDIADILDDSGKVLPVRQWPLVWRTSISGMDTHEVLTSDTETIVHKLKWPDKLKNLELLGKHIGVSAFSENVKHSGEIEVREIRRTIVEASKAQ